MAAAHANLSSIAQMYKNLWFVFTLNSEEERQRRGRFSKLVQCEQT